MSPKLLHFQISLTITTKQIPIPIDVELSQLTLSATILLVISSSISQPNLPIMIPTFLL